MSGMALRGAKQARGYGQPVYRIDIIGDINDPFASDGADIRNDSQAVLAIQNALDAAGGFLQAAGGTPTGTWDQATEQATLGFQIAQGFAPQDQDGNPGPETLDALGVQLPSGGGDTNAVGQVPAGTVMSVLDIQTLLNADGFPVTVDGVWGPQTQAAVTQLQHEAGIPEDGVVGQVTWNVLVTVYGGRVSADLTLPSGVVVHGSSSVDPSTLPIPDPSPTPGPKPDPVPPPLPGPGPAPSPPPAVVSSTTPAKVILGLAAVAAGVLWWKKRKKRR